MTTSGTSNLHPTPAASKSSFQAPLPSRPSLLPPSSNTVNSFLPHLLPSASISAFDQLASIAIPSDDEDRKYRECEGSEQRQLTLCHDFLPVQRSCAVHCTSVIAVRSSDLGHRQTNASYEMWTHSGMSLSLECVRTLGITCGDTKGEVSVFVLEDWVIGLVGWVGGARG
ncbi:hypothetical protein L226DRAFT_537307 [Lentinus tigrinus ALCF2SS1-7]|uniref:Uncharacterized protein n=1 Tax=Lentinus tigrinus ALCF2SS1-6 TaxID=1328759 RepID=A0A5C2S3E4_9APHY|nr:hypothetical protein L227DRAFT_577482 [Lentinus tigrinus ALCF2SS1-6]RPD72191.1 hypothetical protein L226DRAFT_537307 [Lentinus tigrinus ALCF2SS1-7]